MSEYKEENESKYSLFITVNEDNNQQFEKVPEIEIERLKNWVRLCEEQVQNKDLEVACQTCGRIFMLITKYHKSTAFLCTQQIANMFLSLLDVDQDKIMFPILCINGCLTNNEECLKLYEKTPLLEKLLAIAQCIAGDEYKSSFQMFRVLFSCICSLLSNSEENREKFIENDGIGLAMHVLTMIEDGDEIVERPIGFIFYYLLQGNEEINEQAKEVMNILLDRRVLAPAFTILEELLKSKENIEEMQSTNIFNNIFDTGEYILELFKSIDNEETVKSERKKAKIIVYNALRVFLDILNCTNETLDCSHFPLNQIFEICLSSTSCYQFTEKSLDTLIAYVEKNAQNAEEMIGMPFIHLMLDKAQNENYNIRVKYCELLLSIFIGLKADKYNLIEYDMWCLIFDTVEDEDSHITKVLADCIDKMLTLGYDVNLFEDFAEKIEQLSEGECKIFEQILSTLTNDD